MGGKVQVLKHCYRQFLQSNDKQPLVWFSLNDVLGLRLLFFFSFHSRFKPTGGLWPADFIPQFWYKIS